MIEEIKGILEKPNVYSFGDECYLYFGDYNKLKHYITNLQEENQRLIENRKEAIEYINKNIVINFDKVGFDTNKIAGIVVDKLLEILQGR